MEKVVIIGANSFQNPLILKAKEMGYETHVFAWASGDIGEKTADVFYPISITEKEQILEICRKIKPAAVVSIGSDLAMLAVNYVAEKLGLPCNDEICVRNTTNKAAMRQCFLEHGIPVPKFAKVELSDAIEKTEEFSYPLVVKPTDRSGSRSVTMVRSVEELEEAVRRAVEDSFENKAIAEEYIEGEEYSCEAISYGGKHRVLAMTKKYTTGAPRYIETGHMEPSGLAPELEEKAEREIVRALEALGVKNGASHSEFRIDKNGKIGIIEIGARMGGDCIGSHLVEISTGYDFVRMVLEVGLGKEPDFTKIREPKIAAIRFLMNEADIERMEKIKETYGKNICYISEIETGRHPVIDSSSRYGYYILALDDEKQAKEILEYDKA
ncbi:MAG: acetyl-CoA carboxylase biotin carboxylase subunit family protein [Lachnospiraceae bacterium]